MVVAGLVAGPNPASVGAFLPKREQINVQSYESYQTQRSAASKGKDELKVSEFMADGDVSVYQRVYHRKPLK